MQREYGQKAPQLEDGSLLINEVTLTSEQTDEVKHDIALTGKVVDGGKRALSLSTAFSFLILVGYITVVVITFLGVSLISSVLFLIALFVASEINKRVYRASVISSAKMLLSIKSRSLVASTVRNFWSTADKGQQTTQHMNLMLHKEINLGGGDTYRLLLDSAVDNGYVLRVVQKPDQKPVVS